jgi:hypothetical protein
MLEVIFEDAPVVLEEVSDIKYRMGRDELAPIQWRKT